MTAWTTYESPIGPLTLIADDDGVLSGLRFPGFRDVVLSASDHRPAVLAGAVEQLMQYFAGERRDFSVELRLRGSNFQRSVWEQLRLIPFGETISYSELAGRLGRADSHHVVRAVGSAVGRTPVPIIVPCHRIIGADGSLTGYGGGLPRKATLLDLEARVASGGAPEPAWAFRQMTLA
jgi:methylated-DNA-[protein]-cysteine S-methyltransferase